MKKFLLIAASFVIGAGTMHSASQILQGNRLNSEYLAAQKDLMRTLIEIEANATAGVNQEKWGELTRDASQKINILKLTKMIELKESFALSDLMRSMSSVGEAWKELQSCRHKTEDADCFDRLARILYSGGYPTLNPQNDNKRFFLDSENANFSEYVAGYKVELARRNTKGYDTEGVSKMISMTTKNIKKYFMIHGIAL